MQPPRPSDDPTSAGGSSEVTRPQRDLRAARAREEVRAKLFGSATPAIQVGRFALLDEIGSGGMGTVFAAYDPQLDRKVAVKVLSDPAASDRGRTRMLREAQAMARLAHPNVVSVFEVGTHDEGVFIAMEFIDGRSLSAWVAESSRTVAEIVATFLQAGRGLAAAHAAGLVHRDFKPQNVLVDRNGRVRVLDFGLARADASASADDPPTSAQHGLTPGSSSGPLLGETITRTGAVLGTPAYMAPEQHLGEPTDGCSDQFAFCVALYEALYGERPFAGSTLPGLVARTCAGEVSPAPADTRVPRPLRAVLLRGLSTRPADRHPDMPSLLHALERFEARPRRRVQLVASALVLGSALVAGWSATRTTAPACDGAPGRAAAVWNADRVERLRTAFERVDQPYAHDAAAAVSRSTEAWIAAWSAAHADACRATHVRGEQSVQALDLRMECLSDRLRAVDATLSVLETADAEVVEHAGAIAADLPGLSRCADLEALREDVAPPEDPAVRAAVEAMRDDLVTAKTLTHTEKYEAALTLLEPLAETATTLGYAPLQAEVSYAIGEALIAGGRIEAARARLLDAYWAARAHGHDRIAAQVAIRLAYAIGYAEQHTEEGLLWTKHAEVELARRAEDLDLASQLANVRGAIHFVHQDLDAARAAFEQGLRLRERYAGPDDPSLATGLVNLGTLLGNGGHLDEADASFRRALKLRLDRQGPDHPATAGVREAYARMLVQAGHYREAQAQLEAALETQRALFAGDHPSVAATLAVLGNTLRHRGDSEAAQVRLQEALAMERRLRGPDAIEVGWTLSDLALAVHDAGDLERARALYTEALTIVRARLGDRHDNTASLLVGLGLVALTEERPDEAEASFREALDIRTEIFGKDSPKIASALEGLADAARAQGRVAEAVGHAERAVKLRETQDPEHPHLVGSLVSLARAHMVAGHPSIAIEELERALAIHEAREGSLDALAEARFALAEALVLTDRDRAHALAASAREWFAKAGPAYAPRVRAIDAWGR